MLHVHDLFNVNGKIILVTGGSRGIGKTIASAFVQNGAKVYITSRKTEDLRCVAAELCAIGPGSCIPLPADLQDYVQVVKLAEELKSREVALHVLVNNAGATWNAPLGQFPFTQDAAFSKVLTLNVQRVFTLTRLLLPLLRAGAAASKQNQDPARVINIGSVEGIGVPSHETYGYSASKAALHHLSRHFASRLGWEGSEGVTSNTIAFGWFESKMTEHSLNTSEKKAKVLSRVPLQRIGQSADIAGVVIFLASPSSAYINGATITVDGGWLVSDTDLRMRASETRARL